MKQINFLLYFIFFQKYYIIKKLRIFFLIETLAKFFSKKNLNQLCSHFFYFFIKQFFISF